MPSKIATRRVERKAMPWNVVRRMRAENVSTERETTGGIKNVVRCFNCNCPMFAYPHESQPVCTDCRDTGVVCNA